jgi:hypothetical protein
VLWQVCRDSGIEGVVLRLPLTYGPGVKGNFLLLLEAIAKGRACPLPASRIAGVSFTSATLSARSTPRYARPQLSVKRCRSPTHNQYRRRT